MHSMPYLWSSVAYDMKQILSWVTTDFGKLEAAIALGLTLPTDSALCQFKWRKKRHFQKIQEVLCKPSH
jgi:hypothetical protein